MAKQYFEKYLTESCFHGSFHNFHNLNISRKMHLMSCVKTCQIQVDVSDVIGLGTYEHRQKGFSGQCNFLNRFSLVSK